MSRFRPKSTEIREKIFEKHVLHKNAQTTAKDRPNTELVPLATQHIVPGHLVQLINQYRKIVIFGQNWSLFEIFGSHKICLRTKPTLHTQNNHRKLQVRGSKHRRTLQKHLYDIIAPLIENSKLFKIWGFVRVFPPLGALCYGAYLSSHYVKYFTLCKVLYTM